MPFIKFLSNYKPEWWNILKSYKTVKNSFNLDELRQKSDKNALHRRTLTELFFLKLLFEGIVGYYRTSENFSVTTSPNDGKFWIRIQLLRIPLIWTNYGRESKKNALYRRTSTELFFLSSYLKVSSDPIGLQTIFQ